MQNEENLVLILFSYWTNYSFPILKKKKSVIKSVFSISQLLGRFGSDLFPYLSKNLNKSILLLLVCLKSHYENMPIQI